MSVPSSKATVTAERPKRLIERISSTRGRPLIAFSTGKVMNCSTSTGPSEGEVVRTCTCTFVRSGTASSGSVATEAAPTPSNTSDMSITTKRL